jgi:hypothetical protein
VKRLLLLSFLIAIVLVVAAAESQAMGEARAPARATKNFTAVFDDRVCGTAPKLCGTGLIDHFGSVRTVAVFSTPTPGPEPGCQTYKGTRTATLVKHRRSTLRFAIRGPACGTRGWGTFRIVSGTGVFSHAGGSGVEWGGTVGPIHYYGVIRLGR